MVRVPWQPASDSQRVSIQECGYDLLGLHVCDIQTDPQLGDVATVVIETFLSGLALCSGSSPSVSMHTVASSCVSGLCLAIAQLPTATVLCEAKLMPAIQRLLSTAHLKAAPALALQLVDAIVRSSAVLSALHRDSVDALYPLLLDICCAADADGGYPGLAAVAFQCMATLFLQAEIDGPSRSNFFKRILRPQLAEAISSRFSVAGMVSIMAQSALDILSRCALEHCSPTPADEATLLTGDSVVSKLVWAIGDACILSLESCPFRWQRIVMRRPSGQLVWLAQLQNAPLSAIPLLDSSSVQQRDAIMHALEGLHLPEELLSHLEDVPEEEVGSAGSSSLRSGSWDLPVPVLKEAQQQRRPTPEPQRPLQHPSPLSPLSTSKSSIPSSPASSRRNRAAGSKPEHSLSISTQALALFSPVEDPSPLDIPPPSLTELMAEPQSPMQAISFGGPSIEPVGSVGSGESPGSAARMKVDVSVFYPPLPSYDNALTLSGEASGRSPSLLPSVDQQLAELGATVHGGKLSLDAQLLLHAAHDPSAASGLVSGEGTSPRPKPERAVVIQASVVRSPEKRSSKRQLLVQPIQTSPSGAPTEPRTESEGGEVKEVSRLSPSVSAAPSPSASERRELLMRQHKRMSADSGLVGAPTDPQGLNQAGRWSLRHRSADRHGVASPHVIGSNRAYATIPGIVSAPTTPQTNSSPQARRLSAGAASQIPENSTLPPSLLFSQLQHGSNDAVDLSRSNILEKNPHRPLRGGEALDRAIAVLDRIFGFETHKIGVLYIGEGQTSQEDILGNRSGSGTYNRFLRRLGSLVPLKEELSKGLYTAGLDRISNADGEYSICWSDPLMQVMFHVVTLMPSTVETDPNFTNKKRHIGNDFVHIVWTESERPYTLETLPGQFNTVAVVVYPLGSDLYRIEVISKLSDEYNRLGGPVSVAKPVTVSEASLCDLVRLTALSYNNLCKMQGFHEKQRPNMLNSEERLRQIKIIAERFCA